MFATAPTVAEASGFDVPHVGSAASNPLSKDAAAVHHNPAQLGLLDRGEFSFGAGLIVGRAGYTRQRRGTYQFADNLEFAEPVDPSSIDAAKTGNASKVAATPLGPIADVFVATPVIADRLVLGAGVYVPYAAILDMPPEGAQRFALKSLTLLSAHTTLSAAVRVHDVLSIGAGVSYVFSLLELSKVQDFAGVDLLSEAFAGDPIRQPNDFGADAPSTVRELDILARPVAITRAVSHSVSFNAGLALTPTDALDLAIVYQHGSQLRFNGKFQLDMDDDLFTQDLASQGLRYPPLVTGTARIKMRLPKRITVGGGYRFGARARLDAWVTYATYQDFDVIELTLVSDDLAQPDLGISNRAPQPLVRRWRGSVLVELAPRVYVTDKLELSAVAGYHSPASPDSTIDMASPDGHRLIFGAGVRYKFSDRFALLADFEGQAIIPRTVSASDYDLANGTYNLFIGQMGVHGQLRFGRSRSGRPVRRFEPTPTPAGDDPVAEPEVAPAPSTPSPRPTPDRRRPPPPPPVGKSTRQLPPAVATTGPPQKTLAIARGIADD